MTKEEARKYLKFDDDEVITDFHVFLAETWEKYDREHEGIPWQPMVDYSVPGDLLKVYLTQSSGCWHWKDGGFSVCHDHETNEVTGFDIWGLKGFLAGRDCPQASYDKEMDTIKASMVSGATIHSQEEVAPGLTVMKDAEGKIVAAEIRGITRLVRQEEEREAALG